MIHRILTLTLITIALVAPAAHANSYWVALGDSNGQPTITPGVDGFSLLQTGGPWNTWSNNCTANPGTYAAGAFCKLRFTVPTGLSAGAVGNGGVARGQMRTANDFFVLRSERPGGNPASVRDSAADGLFVHGWGALGSYVDFGLFVTGKTTTTSQSNWFHLDDFQLVLSDPSAPAIQYVSPAGGAWKGTGCTPLSYAWADSGSQMWSTSVVNLNTGAVVDSWAAAPGRTVVQSGVPVATRATCLPAQPTGTYTYRTTGTDRSGNASTSDFQITFDTTNPVVSEPTLGGSAIADEQIVNTYRPNISWSVRDDHSGLNTVTARIDDSPVVVNQAAGVATLTPTNDLPLGTHSLTLTATDFVGNTTSVGRRIVITDTTAPTITVQQPGTFGGNSPVLDVSATDDRSGVATTTWGVTVNGEPILVDPSGTRLQADLGYLINGVHTVDVRVSDQAGNVAHSVIRYTARSDNSGTIIPKLTGIQVLEAPATIGEGVAVRVHAAAVNAGRPLASMRAEIHQGPTTIAAKPISSDGTVDISLTLNQAGPLTLIVNGSGLPEQTIEYKFVAKSGTGSASAAASATAVRVPPAVVAKVITGDTLRLRDGRTIRLAQVDAPDASQCYGGRATRELAKILKPGTMVALSSDAKIGAADSRGRLIRYVAVGRLSVNRTLVLRGAAAPSFDHGKRGRLAKQLLKDAAVARKHHTGLWGACPTTKLDPASTIATGPT